MPTVQSRPNNYASAYTPLEYTFTSIKAGIEASAYTFIEDGDGAGDGKVAIGINVSTIGLTFPGGETSSSTLLHMPVGAKAIISNTNLYDGEYFIIESSTNGRITIDTPYIGNDTNGNITVFWDNVQVVADMYIDGSFLSRKRRFPDVDGIFTVNFEKEVQSELGVGLRPKDITGTGYDTSKVNENMANIRIHYLVQTSNDGVFETFPNSDGSLFTDTISKNVVNAVVPYAQWKLGTTRGELENVSTDLTDFKIDTDDIAQVADLDIRFLTNSPKTITIGQDDSYELSFLIEQGSFLSQRIEVVFYDESGSVLLTHNPPSNDSTSNTDGVFSFHAGLRDITPQYPGQSTAMLLAHYYEVRLINGAYDLTETIRFNVDKKCYGSETRFKWLNPRGGYDSYTFKSPRKLKSSVSKETYEPARVHPVSLGNRERSILDVDARDVVTVSTNKINREEVEWLQELLESPDVYLELPVGTTSGDSFIPVEIVNKSRNVSDSFNSLHSMGLSYIYSYKKTIIRAN